MYISANKYNEVTGRDISQANDLRIKMASRLLDSRIGNYIRVNDSDNEYDGYKLDLDGLRSWQKEAVENWVSWMVAALYENNDAPDTFQSIQLGRFSVTENESDQNSNLPGLVRYADMELRDAKIINTRVRSNRYVNRREDECI